jgi:hypothetical protein
MDPLCDLELTAAATDFAPELGPADLPALPVAGRTDDEDDDDDDWDDDDDDWDDDDEEEDE